MTESVDDINVLHILLAILIFGILILIHETGHYLMARAFRVTIKEFAIGMGPKIISKKSKKTGIAYSLRLFPIGGFVAMEGEDDESEDENAFTRKPVWQRILITAAGAVTNIVIGILVMVIIIACQERIPSNTIGAQPLNEQGINYSYEAGLRVGDTFVSVDGTRVHTSTETFYEIMRKGVKPIDIQVERDGEVITIEDVTFPTFEEQGTVFGDIDFQVYADQKNVGTVLREGFFRSWSTIKMIWESIIDLITGRYSIQSISGPVGVTKALGEAAARGGFDFIYLAVVISMNLGVMNLLPLPALDGGRLLFQFIELIFRKPVPRKAEGYVHFAGMAVLLALMAVIVVKDVIQLIR